MKARKFSNLSDLLNAVVQVEHGSKAALAQRLLNQPTQLAPQQKPSQLYYELQQLAQDTLGGKAMEQVEDIAKLKLIAILPPTAQAFLSLAPKDKSWDDILSAADELTQPPPSTSASPCGVATVVSQSEGYQEKPIYSVTWLRGSRELK